jgi:integrase
VERGKTPVLTAEETRELLDPIDTDSIGGLRDRALIGVLVYSFARIGAALTTKVEDYFPEGKRWKLRLQEKGRGTCRGGPRHARRMSRGIPRRRRHPRREKGTR